MTYYIIYLAILTLAGLDRFCCVLFCIEIIDFNNLHCKKMWQQRKSK